MLLAVVSLCLAAPVAAQVGVSVAAQSDYRFRGVSLTDGKPDVSLAIAYDHDGGGYAGASVFGVVTGSGDARILGYMDYIGYSSRFRTGMAWDLGLVNARYTTPTKYPYAVDYTEIYAGLAADNASLHIYYSPNYFDEGISTVYVDLDGAFRPSRRWRLFGHVGALAPLDGSARRGGERAYFDVRAGVAVEFKGCEVQLAWTTTTRGKAFPNHYPQPREGLVLGATFGF